MKRIRRFGNPKLFYFSYQHTWLGYDFSISLFGIHYFSFWGKHKKVKFIEFWDRWVWMITFKNAKGRNQ